MAPRNVGLVYLGINLIQCSAGASLHATRRCIRTPLRRNLPRSGLVYRGWGDEEIEAAIECLPPEEYRRIVEWFRLRGQERWDGQMDADSASGKLDFLFDEAQK
jgi:hypothetical protein